MKDESSAAGERSGDSVIIAVGVAIVGFCVLAWLLLSRVSPYIDTAFQIDISRTPTFGGFVDRMVADNQAPAAQLLFWLAAKLGLQGIDEQRLMSLVTASLGYVGAAILGTRWRAQPREDAFGRLLADRRVVGLATALAVVSAGVFPISSFVRYSSLLGPVWLLTFLLSTRAVTGEPGLVFGCGLVIGLAGLIAYSVLIPLACALLLFLLHRGTRGPAYSAVSRPVSGSA